MKYFLYLSILLLLGLSSCKSLEKRCAERFPQQSTEVVRETVRTDTIIEPWHTVEYVDTTICLPSTDTTYVIKTITKELPGDTIFYDVVCTDTITINQDQPKIIYLQSEIVKMETKLKKQKGKYTSLLWVVIGLLSFIIISQLFKRFKK